MKKLIVFAVFVFLLALPASAQEYDSVRLRFAVSGTEQGVDYLTADYFKKQIEEQSGGKVKIQLFANNILSGGSMSEAANLLIQGGAYEMGIFSSAVLSNLDPSFLVVQLPFIFKDYADVNRYHDSTGGAWMKEMMARYGIVYIGAEHNGLKQWTNKKEEKHKPDDFKNFKIRIPGGEVATMTWKTLGADPVSMSWSETYTALQQGTVDGHENSYQTIFSNNIHEIQKYITESYYVYDGYWMMYNAKDWARLNPATQDLIMKLGGEACVWGRKYMEEQEGEIKAKMAAGGSVITVLTPEERQVFVDATRPVIEHFRGVYGEEAYKAWGIQ